MPPCLRLVSPGPALCRLPSSVCGCHHGCLPSALAPLCWLRLGVCSPAHMTHGGSGGESQGSVCIVKATLVQFWWALYQGTFLLYIHQFLCSPETWLSLNTQSIPTGQSHSRHSVLSWLLKVPGEVPGPTFKSSRYPESTTGRGH